MAVFLAGCGTPSGTATESFQGVIELEETPVGFELGGRVLEIVVSEGDEVHAGQILARTDDGLDRSSRAAHASEAGVAASQTKAVRAGARREEVRASAARVEAARATEELLKKQLARQRELFAQGAVSAASLDEISSQAARAASERAALEHALQLLEQGARHEDISVAEARARAAEAAVEIDEQRLIRHELRAPRDGTIVDVNFDPGEVVAAGAPIVTLADPHRPYVDVFVAQAKISQISLGERAKVRIDALGHALSGSVERIARRTEFTPRFLFSERERPNLVVRVRVRIEDPKAELRAGVPAFIDFSPGEPKRLVPPPGSALAAPASSPSSIEAR